MLWVVENYCITIYQIYGMSGVLMLTITSHLLSMAKTRWAILQYHSPSEVSEILMALLLHCQMSPYFLKTKSRVIIRVGLIQVETKFLLNIEMRRTAILCLMNSMQNG